MPGFLFYSTYMTELLILVPEKFSCFFVFLFSFFSPHCADYPCTRLKTKQCKNLHQRRRRWSLNIYSRLMTFPFGGLVRNNKALHLPSASAQALLPSSFPPSRRPRVAQKSDFIAERCQNFKQALSLSPASPSSFPLIPERLGRGRLLTLTCSSARIMLASLSNQ